MTRSTVRAARPSPARFAGYAAIFGRPDAGGDVIRAGAFSASLAAIRAKGEPLPLLWQHRPEHVIGWVEYAAEDARGLRIIARLADPAGSRAALLAGGDVTGLSFGYRARGARAVALDGVPARELSAVDIFEVSLVTAPMQKDARVHLVV